MKRLVFSESFLEFLSNIYGESKIARLIIGSIRARRDGFNYIYGAVIRTDAVNYITYRNNGLISYMPADRVQETNDDGTWKREGRQEGRPAKVMRRIFTDNALKCLKDTDFEIFNNKYKAEYSTEGFSFEVLPAEKIPDVYCMAIMDGGASLGNSCMNGDRDYLDMYANCKSLEIIVLKNEKGLLAGRSLLWTLQDEDETIKFADRFYVAEDHMYEAMISFVESKGWWRKLHYKTYDYKREFIKPDGKQVYRTFKVETDTNFDSYPYIDTFQYGYDGWLTNNGSDYKYRYSETDGTREGGDNVYDEIDEENISIDDAVQIDRGSRRAYWTHRNNVVYIDGNSWWRGDDDIREIDGQWYHCDDVVYSDYDSEDYLAEDCVYSEHHESWILKSDAYCVAGKYYHEDVVEKL